MGLQFEPIFCPLQKNLCPLFEVFCCKALHELKLYQKLNQISFSTSKYPTFMKICRVISNWGGGQLLPTTLPPTISASASFDRENPSCGHSKAGLMKNRTLNSKSVMTYKSTGCRGVNLDSERGAHSVRYPR